VEVEEGEGRWEKGEEDWLINTYNADVIVMREQDGKKAEAMRSGACGLYVSACLLSTRSVDLVCL